MDKIKVYEEVNIEKQIIVSDIRESFLVRLRRHILCCRARYGSRSRDNDVKKVLEF